MIKGKPFVKWANVKRQIIDKLKEYVPKDLIPTMNHLWVEEHYYLSYLLKKQVINDSNKELMNV